ncbi:MAG: sigma 54-interacting transcriptional regulator, partial [Arenicella sp.]|nr:sigma 54-interacting transcriptional regulator [Arenicella sp.]
VLAATNRDLEQQVADGRFREDLYHRLNVIRIDMPPLRDRVEDIPLLAQKFLGDSAVELQVGRKSLSDAALTRMMAFEWPGNVRQLENVCRWITVMAPAQLVSEEDLPKELLDAPVDDKPREWEQTLAKLVRQKLNTGQQKISADLVKRFEATLLTEALDYTGGHRQKAAKLLGWGRNTLTRKFNDLDLD